MLCRWVVQNIRCSSIAPKGASIILFLQPLINGFVPYVDTLEDIGIFLILPEGEELDLSRYMAGYEE